MGTSFLIDFHAFLEFGCVVGTCSDNRYKLTPEQVGSQEVLGYMVFPGLSVEFANRTKKAKTSKFFTDFLHKNPSLVRSDLAWTRIFKSPDNVPRAASLYGHIRKTDIDFELMKTCMHTLLETRLAPLFENTSVLDPSAIPVVAKSSAGLLGKYLGCPHKGDFYAKYGELIYCYFNNYDLLGFVEIWKEFGKEEITKTRKFVNDDIRSISCAPPLLHMAGSMLEHDFNEQYSKLGNGIGFSKWYGGLHRLAQDLKYFNERGDCEKWDRSMAEIAFHFITTIRFVCLKPHFQTEEIWSKMMKGMNEKIHTRRYLPNLQVLQKHDGNPSGSWSTSYDNDIWHWMVRLYTFSKLTGMHPREFEKHVKLNTYSDDYTESSTGYIIDAGYVADKKPEIFAQCGLNLKLEVPHYISGPEGVEYLGNVLTFSSKLNKYVAVPSRVDKTYASMMYPEKNESVDTALTRATQLWVENYFHPEMSILTSKYVRYLRSIGGQVTAQGTDLGYSLDRIRSSKDVEQLWSGSEATLLF